MACLAMMKMRAFRMRYVPRAQPGTLSAAFMTFRAFSADGWMMLVKMASEGVT